MRGLPSPGKCIASLSRKLVTRSSGTAFAARPAVKEACEQAWSGQTQPPWRGPSTGRPGHRGDSEPLNAAPALLAHARRARRARRG
eukprot:365602-Chlamydomonas_euryale.AAC.5